MPTFLDKNKKKSPLAALLLFFRTRKTVTALLLLLALFSWLVVSPSDPLYRFRGSARGGVGVAWTAKDKTAGPGGKAGGWASLLRGARAPDAAEVAGAGSLGFVKANVKELEASGGAGVAVSKPESVDGVLTPEEAKEDHGEGRAVALSESGIAGARVGLVKSAFAAALGAESASVSSGKGMFSGGTLAASDIFGGAIGAASRKLEDVVKGGLASIKVSTVKGVPIPGGAKGQISASKAAQIAARSAKGQVGARTISGQRAFVQAVAANSRALIAVSPNCTEGSGCPGEFAATNTGAVYDGNSITGARTDILSIPGLGGSGASANLPSTALADEYVKAAEQMDADALKCRDLDDKYSPLERENDRKQESLSRQFDSMGCGMGSCSMAKAIACRDLGNAMKLLCKDTMEIRCKHIHECALTAKNNCSPEDECDGPPRIKTHIDDTNDGIRTQTVDDEPGPLPGGAPGGGSGHPAPSIVRPVGGEESESCEAARQNTTQAVQSARNAIDAYRGAGCEVLYPSSLPEDKLRYLATCVGRENQVVDTCRNYANSMCSSARVCYGTVCSGDAGDCVIANLLGIEEFISK